MSTCTQIQFDFDRSSGSPVGSPCAPATAPAPANQNPPYDPGTTQASPEPDQHPSATTTPDFSVPRRGTGTREWSDASLNICDGCSHDCLYCYARALAIRFHRSSPADWATMRLKPDRASRVAKFVKPAVVMFPTTHDLTPEILPEAEAAIQTVLARGNKLLLVTKPHVEVIRTLCAQLQKHRQNVLFRFTIGSLNPATCKLWEPGAPSPQERLAALQHAHQQGYGTSVSMEPMLEDTAQMVAAVGTLEPFVTDTIWLGKLNGGIPRSRQTPAVAAALAQLRAAQSDAEILRLVAMLQTHHKVRWKDSITEVLRETPAPGAP